MWHCLIQKKVFSKNIKGKTLSNIEIFYEDDEAFKAKFLIV